MRMMMRAGAVLALCTGCCLVGENTQRPLRVEVSAGGSLVAVSDRVRTLLFMLAFGYDLCYYPCQVEMYLSVGVADKRV